MIHVTEWWNSLGLVGQIFALIAIQSTLVLVVQTVLLLFGIGDGDGDVDPGCDCGGDVDIHGDVGGDGDGFALFSVRGVVAMLAIGGWSGLAMYQSGLDLWLTVILSLVFGAVALVVIAYMMRGVMKLQDSGNIEIDGAKGKCAKVYIPIPAGMSGTGKVNLTLQDRFIEADAVTSSDRALKTGESVVVTAVDGSGTLVVEPIPTKAEPDKIGENIPGDRQ